ncbi:Transcriptional regulator SlyA [Tsuneonella dongtanensis]|uniref:Transcriptional regulator SlyA n=2 Tax=Tsuneonella dongtanensis TaxID=692370 RepID=A0A1B2AFF7_9SPHN|nr:Transcriptional regulator SlyA [Tsuneonella dongtanensis]
MPYLLTDSARLLRRAFNERVRKTGATSQQARLLLNIERMPDQNQAYYAEKLEIEPITLCRMVDRMEEAGLIERRADPGDRRARVLHLTERSRGEIERIRSGLAGLIETMLDGFDDSEQAQLAAMLARISENLSVPAEELAVNG